MKPVFRFASLAVVTAVAFLPGTAKLETTYLSGASCQSANLAQAFQLDWNHYRIFNPSPYQRWVICPFDNNYSYDGATNGYQDNFRVGTYHEATSSVWCIVRRYPFDQANAAVEFSSVVITPTGPFPRGADTIVPTNNVDGYGAKSIACRLDPGTGVNGMLTFH